MCTCASSLGGAAELRRRDPKGTGLINLWRCAGWHRRRGPRRGTYRCPAALPWPPQSARAPWCRRPPPRRPPSLRTRSSQITITKEGTLRVGAGAIGGSGLLVVASTFEEAEVAVENGLQERVARLRRNPIHGDGGTASGEDGGSAAPETLTPVRREQSQSQWQSQSRWRSAADGEWLLICTPLCQASFWFGEIL